MKIKFRAWDKHKRVMCDVLNINFDADVVHIMDPKTNLYWGRKIKEVELLQYIGREDSKGTEIFEGDIIQFTGHVNATAVIQFNEHLGVYQAVTEKSSWIPCRESGVEQTVIGNAFKK